MCGVRGTPGLVVGSVEEVVDCGGEAAGIAWSGSEVLRVPKETMVDGWWGGAGIGAG